MKIDHRHENSGRFPFTEAKEGCRPNLIKARLNKNWTQNYVSEMIGCSQEEYSLIESGKRAGRKYWPALCQLFSMTEDELMATEHKAPDWKPYIFKRGEV